jgi:hypothetical protein
VEYAARPGREPSTLHCLIMNSEMAFHDLGAKAAFFEEFKTHCDHKKRIPSESSTITYCQ